MDLKKRLKNRESLEEILKSKATFERIEYIREILSALSSIICIINHQNQVVFTNDVMLNKFGLDLEKNILGKRPGEFLDCVNAKNDTGGCGTTEHCEYCGAFNAIDISWREKRKITRECKITSTKDNYIHQLDLEITATPMFFDGDYLVISINDISDKKHKQLLEGIFFHDVLNIAGSLSGVLKIIPELKEEEEKEEHLTIVNSLSDQIIDEIKAQRQMIQAENGDLLLHILEIEIEDFLNDVSNKIRFHQVAFEKEIIVNNFTNSLTIKTDTVLLSRILINMAKNALEATKRGNAIKIEAKIEANKYFRFSVFNQSYIPRSTQMQLFKRSFSTKGINRGLGTYSMKLLGERYLQGKVGFKSTTEEGTVFYIDVPITISQDQ